MKHLMTESVFAAWAQDPDTTPQQLRDTMKFLSDQRALLWTPGADESYYRDRYERDAKLVGRIGCCQKVLNQMEVAGA